jgi:HEAT repeat protein
MTPRESIERECRHRGREAVVTGCLDLIEGHEVDPELIVALGGPPARWAITGGDGGPDYWLRVWAARGLLWAWDDRSAARASVVAMTRDSSWRVREMAATVAARHRVGEALEAMQALQQDPVPRVRAAAERAAARIVAARA